MVDKVVVPITEGISNTPAAGTLNPDSPGKPKWLPEKFKTPEDLAKSYQELEKQYTQLRQGKAPPVDEKPVVDDKPVEKLEEAPDGAKNATVEEVKGLLPGFTEDKIQEFSQTALETGKLTDAQYAELQGKGYSREIVDQYIQGQMAVAEGQRNALINAGGGEQQVQAMFTWAAANLDKASVDAYNAKFDAGGTDAMMAMENLVAKYKQSGLAKTQGLVGMGAGNAPSSESSSVYRSAAQVQADMADPRYKVDPAFRAEVAKKIGRSNVL